MLDRQFAEFAPSAAFQGVSKEGFAFENGDRGVGYGADPSAAPSPASVVVASEVGGGGGGAVDDVEDAKRLAMARRAGRRDALELSPALRWRCGQKAKERAPSSNWQAVMASKNRGLPQRGAMAAGASGASGANPLLKEKDHISWLHRRSMHATAAEEVRAAAVAAPGAGPRKVWLSHRVQPEPELDSVFSPRRGGAPRSG